MNYLFKSDAGKGPTLTRFIVSLSRTSQPQIVSPVSRVPARPFSSVENARAVSQGRGCRGCSSSSLVGTGGLWSWFADDQTVCEHVLCVMASSSSSSVRKERFFGLVIRSRRRRRRRRRDVQIVIMLVLFLFEYNNVVIMLPVK